MARPSHPAAAVAAAGAGLLLLCGCGSSAAPAAAGPAAATSTGPGRLASRFCTDAATFMRKVPAGPRTKNLTPTQAQADMTAVLVSTVKGYARLEKEAPARLREPLKKIIRVYTSDEKILKKTGDMARVSDTMVRNDGAGAAAEQQVVKYISVGCP